MLRTVSSIMGTCPWGGSPSREAVLELSEIWAGGDMEAVFKFAGEKQSRCLVEWAKNIPHFTELAIDDQVILMIYGLTFHELWTFFDIIGIWSRGLGLGLDNSSSTRG